jgi:hypothetical protein
MSLRNEVEKLIQIEREKIAARERKHDDYHSRQRERFAAIRPVLQELVDSIETGYIRARIDDDLARLDVGKNNDRCFETDIRWEVQPNFGIRAEADKDGGLFYEEPGFRVDETQHYHSLELFHPGSGSASERKLIFPNESQTCEYLITKIVEKVAFYQHLANLGQRAKAT